MPKARSFLQGFQFLRGNIRVLTITQSVGMFCRSMVFPYASLYILALGGDPARIGFVNSVGPLAGLIIFPIAGCLTDRTGRVRIIAFAGYFSAAVTFMYVLAPSWETIAVARLLQGFMVLQFPPLSALMADSLSPENRGRGIATMNTISSALAIVAPYVAGALLDAYDVELGMRVLYGVMAIASLISAAVNHRFLKETSSRPAETFRLCDLPGVFKSAYGDLPTTLRRLPPALRALTAVITLGFMANAVASPFWVVFGADHIGLSSSEWGLILLIETALRSLAYIPAGMIVDRHGRTRWILASLCLSLVSVPLFVLATNFTQALLIRAAVAVVTAFFIPACSALMADIVPRDIRGRVMSAIGRGTVMIGAASGGTGGPGMGFLITIPVIVASSLGGYLYTFDPTYPWIFVAVTTAISILLTALFVRDPREAEL
jgi:MFS family permease